MLSYMGTQAEWEHAQTQGEYRAASLAMEGFIHGSTRQPLPFGNNLGGGSRPGLPRLIINRARIAALVQDDDIGGGRRFGPIHGSLNLDAALEARLFGPAANGTFPMPEEASADLTQTAARAIIGVVGNSITFG